MKLTAVLLGVAFVSLVGAKPDDPKEVMTAPPPPSVSSPSTSTLSAASTEPNSPTTSTTTTTSTSAPTTSSTPSSNITTTPAPPTTSSTSQPTSPTTPSTTTPIPTTSSTTSKPSPKPAPKEYYWEVTDDNNNTCILAKADINLKLTYTNATSGKQVTKDIQILPNATSSGMCDENNQVLQLTLGNTAVAFYFHQNNSGDYHLSQIKSNITLDQALGNQSFISLASDKMSVFKTKLNTSYECRWSEPSVLKEDDEYMNTTKATLHLNMGNIRFEAFRRTAGDVFSKAYACEMDNTDLVPIMVGIALGILVAVVLIAYLVGRRSTQAQGYLSM